MVKITVLFVRENEYNFMLYKKKKKKATYTEYDNFLQFSRCNQKCTIFRYATPRNVPLVTVKTVNCLARTRK